MNMSDSMTEDELLEELKKLPIHQQEHTTQFWHLAGSMQVCWICGDTEAALRKVKGISGYF